jgi:trans-2,3-dihydro-3-hydroxyanthranilate isomerase
VSLKFLQVDVFAEGPYEGNPLAVFPDSGDLSTVQMQSIASEMNLSETTFVDSYERSSYELRIFTPQEELPFAGHPTIGTAWTLLHLGLISGPELVQRSAAGATKLTRDGDLLWLERTGEAEADSEDTNPGFAAQVATALGVERGEVGLEAREFGRSGRLRPAYSNAGVRQLMVPLKDLDVLGRCTPRAEGLARLGGLGAYCFTASKAGRLRARGFFPGAGVAEDPATGSAAAALGLYLADRMGSVDLEIAQGVEMGRPSRIHLRAGPGVVRVAGRCHLVLKGNLEELPGP